MSSTLAPTIDSMPRKPSPQKKDRSVDRHKPGRMARIRQGFAELATEAADEMLIEFTEWVNAAVREKLQREGRWPPDKQK